MTNFTLTKAEKLLNLALENYEEELKDYIIGIKKSNKFSVAISFLNCNIKITNKMQSPSFKEFLPGYLREIFNFNTNNYGIYDFNECFAFLHEIGHLVHYTECDNEEEQYNYFYSQLANNSSREAFYKYREIETERLADSFAVEMLTKFKVEIWAIMNEISISKAKEEISVWDLFK